jgi:hypothetical protein
MGHMAAEELSSFDLLRGRNQVLAVPFVPSLALVPGPGMMTRVFAGM